MDPASLVALRTGAAASAAVNRSFTWQQVSVFVTASDTQEDAATHGIQIWSETGCKTCKGKGAVECEGCKGTGRNKKNGNIFERWKCFDCQGFGMKVCPSCGKGGLTPEQRGER